MDPSDEGVLVLVVVGLTADATGGAVGTWLLTDDDGAVVADTVEAAVDADDVTVEV